MGMGRMRSISSGRIPLKEGSSISLSRVGIGARRVRSTSTARSVEASRRPLGESQMAMDGERQLIIGEESILQSRGSEARVKESSASPSREHSRSKKRVTFCEDVIEHEPCEYSDDSMEEGEVDSSNELNEEDSEGEEEEEQEKEEFDEGDLRDIDVEVRSS